MTTFLLLVSICSRCGIWLYNQSLPPKKSKQNISNLMFNTMILMMLVFICEQFIWAFFVQNALSHIELNTTKCLIFYPTHIMLYVTGKSLLYLLFSFRLQAVFGNNSSLAYPRWVLLIYQFLCTIVPIGTAGAIIYCFGVERHFIQVSHIVNSNSNSNSNIEICIPWQDHKFYHYFTLSLIIYDAIFSFVAFYLFVRKLYQISSLQRDQRSGSLVRPKKILYQTPTSHTKTYKYAGSNKRAKHTKHVKQEQYTEYNNNHKAGSFQNAMTRKYRWHNDMIDKNIRLLYVMKKSTFLVFMSIISTLGVNIGLGFFNEKIGFFLVCDGLISSLAAMSLFKFADPMYNIFCKPFEIIVTSYLKCTCYCIQVYICCKNKQDFIQSDLNVIMSSDKIKSQAKQKQEKEKEKVKVKVKEKRKQSTDDKIVQKIQNNIHQYNLIDNNNPNLNKLDAQHLDTSLSVQVTSNNETRISIDQPTYACAITNKQNDDNFNNLRENLNANTIENINVDSDKNNYNGNSNQTLSSIFSQTPDTKTFGSNTSTILQNQPISETRTKTITSYTTFSPTDVVAIDCSKELSVN